MRSEAYTKEVTILNSFNNEKKVLKIKQLECKTFSFSKTDKKQCKIQKLKMKNKCKISNDQSTS